jgi:hypothetical protein
MSSFQGVQETIVAKGLFCSLYTDRGSHYFHTPVAGHPVARDTLTQFGRALRQLAIRHIPAYSPEARGRSERMFGTLQDRLPKELEDAAVTTLGAANAFLRETYLPAHNRRFAVDPEQDGSALVPRRGLNRPTAGQARITEIAVGEPPSGTMHNRTCAKIQLERGILRPPFAL